MVTKTIHRCDVHIIHIQSNDGDSKEYMFAVTAVNLAGSSNVNLAGSSNNSNAVLVAATIPG